MFYCLHLSGIQSVIIRLIEIEIPDCIEYNAILIILDAFIDNLGAYWLVVYGIYEYFPYDECRSVGQSIEL